MRQDSGFENSVAVLSFKLKLSERECNEMISYVSKLVNDRRKR